MLWASQVAVGHENGLRLRVYGEQGALAWMQEHPNELHVAQLGEAPRAVTRGSVSAGPAAARATRIPAGHPEGYLEAFAQLYRDFAEQVRAKMEGRATEPAACLVPGVRDGLRGVAFIAAAIGSSERDGAWTAIDAGE